VQRVRGEAGAEASLSLAGRLVSGTGYRLGASGGLVAHLKAGPFTVVDERYGWCATRRCCPQLRGRLEHTEGTI
jgi:hypothetical protein